MKLRLEVKGSDDFEIIFRMVSLGKVDKVSVNQHAIKFQIRYVPIKHGVINAKLQYLLVGGRVEFEIYPFLTLLDMVLEMMRKFTPLLFRTNAIS